ncbi:MAG: prepilin-type N-terminal cleavage/methylation domain-containing protein [Chloroflexi bacterium]|nr:prepilin-type N-terminal cleavage/methylation domain-containing protein [Chloroflexota bacterium]
MKGSRRSQGGFTLVEIMVVLAVLAILAAVVIPNVGGFLNRGKDNAYKADQRMLQAAVDAWRSNTRTRSGNQWPLVGSTNVISIPALVDENFLRGNDVVPSANTSVHTGATNNPSGTYTWGINTSTGVVTSTPSYSTGVYP